MNILFITVPYYSGSYRKGAGLGPDHVLSPSFIDELKKKGHRCSVQEISYPEEWLLPEVQSSFRLNSMLSEFISSKSRGDQFPIIVSGNCSSSIGTLAGLHAESMGVVWFDAHGDYNNPEISESGYFDGMALSIIAGRCWNTIANRIPHYSPVEDERIILLGARDIDPLESAALQKSSIRVLSTDQLRKKEYEIDNLPRKIMIHFDADVLDKSVGNANRFASENGLFPEEIDKALTFLVDHAEVLSFSIAAYDPSGDSDNRISKAISWILTRFVSYLSNKNDNPKSGPIAAGS